MLDTSPAATRRHIIDTLTARTNHGLTPTETALLRAKIREERDAAWELRVEQGRDRARAETAEQQLAEVRKKRDAAERTLDRIPAARTWGEVWSQLGMYYGLSAIQAGREARDRHTAAERTAEQRAEKAEAEAAELAEARDEMLRIIADWITQNDNAKTVDTNQLIWNLEDAGYPLPGLGLNEDEDRASIAGPAGIPALRKAVYDILNIDENFAGCPSITTDKLMAHVVQPLADKLDRCARLNKEILDGTGRPRPGQPAEVTLTIPFTQLDIQQWEVVLDVERCHLPRLRRAIDRLLGVESPAENSSEPAPGLNFDTDARLREQYAEAIHEELAHCVHKALGNDCGNLADAVLAVRDRHMEQLRAELAELREQIAIDTDVMEKADRACDEHIDAGRKLKAWGEEQHARAERAEAALDRVRDLHERDALGRCTYCTWLDDEAGAGLDVTWPCDTIRTLDGPAAQAAAHPVHDDQPRGCAIPTQGAVHVEGADA